MFQNETFLEYQKLPYITKFDIILNDVQESHGPHRSPEQQFLDSLHKYLC